MRNSSFRPPSNNPEGGKAGNGFFFSFYSIYLSSLISSRRGRTLDKNFPVRNMHKKKLEHLSSIRNNWHNSYKLQKSFNEHGESVFTFYALSIIDLNKAFENRNSNEITDAKIKSVLYVEGQVFINRFRPSLNVDEDVYDYRRKRRYWIWKIVSELSHKLGKTGLNWINQRRG